MRCRRRIANGGVDAGLPPPNLSSDSTRRRQPKWAQKRGTICDTRYLVGSAVRFSSIGPYSLVLAKSFRFRRLTYRCLCVRFHPFVVSGQFCRHDVTRNDTCRARLRGKSLEVEVFHHPRTGSSLSTDAGPASGQVCIPTRGGSPHKSARSMTDVTGRLLMTHLRWTDGLR